MFWERVYPFGLQLFYWNKFVRNIQIYTVLCWIWSWAVCCHLTFLLHVPKEKSPRRIILLSEGQSRIYISPLNPLDRLKHICWWMWYVTYYAAESACCWCSWSFWLLCQWTNRQWNFLPWTLFQRDISLFVACLTSLGCCTLLGYLGLENEPHWRQHC